MERVLHRLSYTNDSCVPGTCTYVHTLPLPQDTQGIHTRSSWVGWSWKPLLETPFFGPGAEETGYCGSTLLRFH